MIARSVVENIASALAENHRIRVFFKGSECFTDGKIIVLPSLPEKLPGQLVELIRGFLDHEVAHIIFTDFAVVESSAKTSIKEKTPLKFILNAVEDIRIERKMAEVYKGCGVNFDKSRDYTTKKLKERWDKAAAAGTDPDDWSDPIFRVMIFFIFICQAGWDDPFVVEYASDIMPILEHLAPEIEATKKMIDTAGALELAKIILAKIETFALPEPEPPIKMEKSTGKKGGDAKTSSPTSGGSGGSETPTGDIEPDESETDDDPLPELGDGESDEAPELELTEPEPKPKPEPKPESKPEESKEPKPEESEDLEPKPEPEPEPEPEDLDRLRERIKKSLESKKSRTLPSMAAEISETAKTVGGYRPFSTEKDSFVAHPTKDISFYNTISGELSGIVTTLRGRLSRILLSQKRSRWAGNKRKGVLNPGQLHQVVAKTSESVYRVKIEGLKMNTAVSILIDLSGSMAGSKISITQQTTIILAETLTKIAIPFEILGFSGDHEYHSIKSSDRKIFNRWGTLNMFFFKRFDEYYGRDQKERIAGMSAHCQNYDGESVLFAANRLKSRPERKKILFVLSDGMPEAASCRRSTLADHLKSVAKDLDKDPSLNLIAFGMKTTAPKAFYRNYVIVNDLATFPEVLMGGLYKQLT